MSGICGAIGGEGYSHAPDTLDLMLAAFQHRGPDSQSRFEHEEPNCAFGHVHLNSFSPAEDAGKPAWLTNDTCVVGIDGGVTNSSDLTAATNGADGHAGHRHALAVAEAWKREGARFPTAVDGPCSVFLYDRKKRELTLSRDKLGEKTLYYAWTGTVLVFGSEIHAVLAHPAVSTELDHASLSLYLAFGYIPGPRTLFRNVFKLLPGQSLTTRGDKTPSPEKYWRLPAIRDGIGDEQECIRRLKDTFLQGLERYTNGAPDVAVFLSGGVDSSIIVAGLKELGVPRIHTFTVGFTMDSASERSSTDLAYAREVATKYDTRHNEVLLSQGHMPARDIAGIVAGFDDLVMTPNTYSKSLLARAVRESGVNSVLTGSAAAGACGVHRKFLDPRKRRRLLKKTDACRTNEERFLALRGRLFDLETQARLLRRGEPISQEAILEVLEQYIGDIESEDFFRLFLFSNLMITSTEKTLKVLDRVGMLNSVELRSPYLDRPLVDLSTQLPASFDGGETFVSLKTHLKLAFEGDLPQTVLDRPVIGYPSYYWNHGELSGLMQDYLNREALESDGIFNYDEVQAILEADRTSDARSKGKKSWALLQFCMWYDIHIKQNLALSM